MNKYYKKNPYNTRFFKKIYYHNNHYYPDYYFSISDINHHTHKYVPDTEYTEHFYNGSYNSTDIFIIIIIILILYITFANI